MVNKNWCVGTPVVIDSVASQLVRLREEKGLTQVELAGRAGVQRGNISRLENCSYNPSLEFLSRLARGLGMELHIELRVPENVNK